MCWVRGCGEVGLHCSWCGGVFRGSLVLCRWLFRVREWVGRRWRCCRLHRWMCCLTGFDESGSKGWLLVHEGWGCFSVARKRKGSHVKMVGFACYTSWLENCSVKMWGKSQRTKWQGWGGAGNGQRRKKTHAKTEKGSPDSNLIFNGWNRLFLNWFEFLVLPVYIFIIIYNKKKIMQKFFSME
jgi:hypothetical protein